MATAVTSSIPHQLSPISLQQISRIRPPRILKGTPSPNSIPQPPGPQPSGKVWVQGQWRDPTSNAAKDRRRIQSRQIEKAVQRQVHGMSIYAYTHARTNQVIYSLTRSLQNVKVLKQLLFHGKKTVPEALRRDMWRPYFSLHFNQTPAGAQTGLVVYQQLRELAIRRQLSPPKELLMTSEEDLYRAKNRRDDPITMTDRIKGHKVKLPNLNQMLPKKLRARKLMNQKGSSVADVAFLLGLINEGVDPEKKYLELEKSRSETFREGTQRARRRLRLIREKESAKEEQINKTAAQVEKANSNEGQFLMDSYTAHRLSLGYQGVMSSSHQMQDLGEINMAKESMEEWHTKTKAGGQVAALASHDKEKLLKEVAVQVQHDWETQHRDSDIVPEVPQELIKQKQNEALQRTEADIDVTGFTTAESADQPDQDSTKVTVLWADLRDGTYAESWSDNVFHGELEPRAASKRSKMAITQFKTVDEEERMTSDVWQPRTVVAGTSVHVIGSELGQWVDGRAEFLASRDSKRVDREEHVNNLELHQASMKIRQLRRASHLRVNQQEYLRHLEENYPAVKVQEDRHDEWMKSSTQRLKLAKRILRLHKKYPDLKDYGEQSHKMLRNDQSEEFGHSIPREKIIAASTRLVRVADLMNETYDMTSILYDLKELEEVDDGETFEQKLVEDNSNDPASDIDAKFQELLDCEHEFSVLESRFPQFSKMEERQDAFVETILERRSEAHRSQLQLDTAKKNSQEYPEDVHSRWSELSKLLHDDGEAMFKIAKDAERQYRQLAETSDEFGKGFETGDRNRGTQHSSANPVSDMRARKRADADRRALRDAGIETDAPRKSIWTRFKGIFGR